MVVDEKILISLGAVEKIFQSGEKIFSKDSYCSYYYQIKKGTVKLFNIEEDGKEFVHGFPFEGHCFGESYLFNDLPYAIEAEAVNEIVIYVLEKDVLISYLKENIYMLLKINTYTAERIHFRYLISSFLIISNPARRIIILFDHLKQYFGVEGQYSFKIPYTRNQISCLTGLRTETVIRTLKKLEVDKKLKILDRKIFYTFLISCNLLFF